MAINSLRNTIQQPSGFKIIGVDYRDSVSKLGAEMSLSVVCKPGTPMLDKPGDIRTFRFKGLGAQDFKCVARKISANGTSTTAGLDYVGLAEKVGMWSPAKPLRFMTLTGEQYRLMLDASGTPGMDGTAKDSLGYIPLVKLGEGLQWNSVYVPSQGWVTVPTASGDEFGTGGWTAHQIANVLAALLDVDAIVTNIPDFWVKELEVSGTYMAALADLYGPHEPRTMLFGRRLIISGMAGFAASQWTGRATVNTCSIISVEESEGTDPPVIAVTGGQGAFDAAYYEGKLSSQTTPSYYGGPIHDSNEDYWAPMGSENFLTDVMYMSYLSYGEPFRYQEIKSEIREVSGEDYPTVTTIVQVYGLANNTDDPSRVAVGATIETETVTLCPRTIFDEPGPPVWKRTRVYIRRFAASETDYDTKLTLSEEYEFTDYGNTLLAEWDKPVSKSAITQAFYYTREIGSVVGEPEIDDNGWITPHLASYHQMTPCSMKVKAAMLPMRRNGAGSQTLERKLALAEVGLGFALYAAETSSQSVKQSGSGSSPVTEWSADMVRGDLVLEETITYAPCIAYPDRIRARITSSINPEDIPEGSFILPNFMDTYFTDPPSIPRTVQAMVNERENCVVQHERKNYRRAGKDAHWIQTITGSLSASDSAKQEGVKKGGRFFYTTTSQRVPKKLPNIAEAKKGMELKTKRWKGGVPLPDTSSMPGPAYTVSAPNIISRYDLETLANYVSYGLRRVTSRVTMEFPAAIWFRKGSRIDLDNNTITVAEGDLFTILEGEIPQALIVESVSVAHDAASGTAKTTIVAESFPA